MIQEAASRGSAGIIRVIPKVAKHMIQKPPIIRKKLPQPPIQREA